MNSLTFDVDHDFRTGIGRVTCAGELNLRTAATLRGVVQKHLADYPVGIIINLDDVLVDNDLALLIFPTMVRRAGDSQLALCARPDSVTGMLLQSKFGLRFPISSSDAQAERAILANELGSTRVRLHLGPAPGAPAQARAMVAQACRNWGLFRHSEHSQLIISELVGNAVRHARTEMEVIAVLGGAYLHLQVRDRSQAVPTMALAKTAAPQQSRGLIIVETLAAGWGTRLTATGKTVWATVRITPLSAARS